MSYLYEDILGTAWSAELASLLPYDIRDDDGILTRTLGEGRKDHLERLDASRALFLPTLEVMSAQDFKRPRELGAYDVSPE